MIVDVNKKKNYSLLIPPLYDGRIIDVVKK